MRKIPDVLDNVHVGWHPLLLQLHDDLTGIDDAYTVGDVKEKFGGLRVYLDTYSPETQPLISVAEARSLTVCEFCGQPGRPRPGGWIKTKCDACVEPRKSE